MIEFAYLGTKWGNPVSGTPSGIITWSFATQNYPGGYQYDAFFSGAYKAAVEKAFATWEAYANIDLVEVADSANSNIRLGWDAIDGKSGQVGEASWHTTANSPNNSLQSAEIRLDISESWALTPEASSRSDFSSVILHEIGHSLGLDHSDDPNNIMYPEGFGPHNIGQGDITGIQLLYGARSTSTTDGNDTFLATENNDSFNGAGGTDTVIFAGLKSTFGVNISSSTSVTVTGQGTDNLVNIERLQFSDGTLALDINGAAGEAYRIYKAAFDRTPDIGGLSYWIKAIDAGASLSTVASGFIGSAEFQQVYGAGSSDAAFVGRLYQNVLDRAGESAGIAYWENALEKGMSRGDVLANFSESNENISGTSALTHDGIWYL